MQGMFAWGDIRRNAVGDRLGDRYFWKQTPIKKNIYDQYYSERCLSTFSELTSSKNFELQLEVGEIDNEDWLEDWVLLSCLEQRWFLKKVLYKRVYSYFYKDQHAFKKGYSTYKYYNDLWFKHLAQAEAERISPFKEALRPYFYSRFRKSDIDKWHELLISKDIDLIELKPRQFSDTTYKKHTLMVTHATSDFDYNLKSKKTIEKYIESFHEKHNPILFLVNNGDQENWFTQNRNATEVLFSRWGEHNFTIKNEVTVVGGQWKNCLRVTLVDLATRHFNSFENELVINLPADAIYTDDATLLSETIFDQSVEELKREIERASLFGGYRIQYEDYHDGWVDVESDMNRYTGKPEINEYRYDLYVKGDLVLKNIGQGSKKIIFKIF